MEGDNAYDASDGGFGKQRAKKGIRFKSLPGILTVLLKRFIFDIETLDTIKTNYEMRFPKRIDMSEFVPDDKDAIYTLYGVTVQTGTVSSGHYYCFLRPWQEEGGEQGLLNWIKFDDEQITRVTDYAALQDNFGGDDLQAHSVWNKSIDEIRKNELWKRSNWPLQSRINNAYILVYIRESLVEAMLRPPQPSAGLVERITRETEQRTTKVLVQVVLERDLLARQPCGFWDTYEGTIESTLPVAEHGHKDKAVEIWKHMHAHLDKTEQFAIKAEQFAMFVLRRRTNRQIRFSSLSHDTLIKNNIAPAHDPTTDPHFSRMFGMNQEMVACNNTPKMTVLAMAANGFNPYSYQWEPDGWGTHENISNSKGAPPQAIFGWVEDTWQLIIKYFCPFTNKILMLGVVYAGNTSKPKHLISWVEKRFDAVHQQHPTLARALPEKFQWGCFEEYSSQEIKKLELNTTLKDNDLYLGDILIFQPLLPEASSGQDGTIRFLNSMYSRVLDL